MSQGFFEQFLIILVGAVVATTLFRRIHLPPILAYLTVGMVLGPYAVGVMPNTHSIELLSELGVVFLLFMLGLEFSFPKMIAMRRTVFGIGTLQVVLCTLVLIGLAMLFGLDFSSALIIAGALSLSSTAIVTRELIRLNELNSPHGQLSVGILIFQDLAAVFFLIVVPTLGAGDDTSSSAETWQSLLYGGGLLLGLLVIGRTLLPLLYQEVARARSDELFVLTTLLTALIAAWITHAAGLSMALGGFLAGMMLGESHYKHQLEADIRPFRDLLLGLFFVSVGMQLDLVALQENWYWVILFSIALMTLKTTLITVIARMLKSDTREALRAGLSLSQGGEFGFALLALALSHQLLSPELSAIVIAVIIVSMALTPLMISKSAAIARAMPGLKTNINPTDSLPQSLSEISAATDELSGHVIICGYGRVGQVIARFLQPLNIKYVSIDCDPVRVSEAAAAGETIYYGDARRTDMIKALGAERAKLLILTAPNDEESLAALHGIKRQFDLPVLVRTSDDSSLTALQEAGAAEVIPESLEGSLMLVSHVLTMLEVPADEIESRIREVRKERYQMLHGYYHGRSSRRVSDDGAPKPVRHAVYLTAGSHAINKTVHDIDLSQLEVEVDTVRRGEEQMSTPASGFTFRQDDIVILLGNADQIEAAEGRLLAG